MAVQGGRRKVRKRKSSAQNSKNKLIFCCGIIGMAVLLGFLTARFVIGPIIGYNAEESPVKILKESEEDKEKDKSSKGNQEKKPQQENKKSSKTQEVSSDEKEGYALQFGAFSTKESAQELASSLKEKGIQTKIVEVGSVFKVISPVIEEKEQAQKELEEVKKKEVTEVFIVWKEY